MTSVSVIMPARNVEAYIGAAIESVCAQTLTDLELLVIDDGSTDGTLGRIEACRASDHRVVLVQGSGQGPGAARNRGLLRARGDWIAVVDADDLILPDRLRSLSAAAASAGADFAADNLTAFYGSGRRDHPWLSGGHWDAEHWITLESFLRSGIGGQANDQPGYLKPILRRAWLTEHKLTYDERLVIGEDYDFVARGLAGGARYLFTPDAGYRYRRHQASTSYRINAAQLEAMIAGLHRLAPHVRARDLEALHARVADLEVDLKFADLVASIKQGSATSLATALFDPQVRLRLGRAAADGLKRRVGLS